MADAFSNPSEVHTAAGVLFDVVVLAGGAAEELVPLCQSTPKPLLPLCNRPLIWYCLKPWVEQGCREFYLCVHKPYDGIKFYLENCKQLEGVKFHFVEVAEHHANDESPTDTCDALLAYHKVKEHSKGEGDHQRDVLVISCDTFLPNVDVAPFISNFYTSFASAGVMLARQAPKKSEPKEQSGGKGKKGGKGGKPADKGPELPKIPQDISCAIMEDSSSHARSSSVPSSSNGIFSQRLHYLCEKDGLPSELNLSPGFMARRPNLNVCVDLIDVHVYLLRHWVLDVLKHNSHKAKEKEKEKLIASGATEETIEAIEESTWRSLRFDVIPSLASNQFPTINKAANVTIDVAGRLNYNKSIPKHWAVQDNTTRSINSLNAMQSNLPNDWDVSRVFATVYEHNEAYQLMRVNSVEKYQAAAQWLLHGLEETASAPLALMSAHNLRAEQQRVTDILIKNKIPSRLAKVNALLSVPPSDAKIRNSIIGTNVKIGSRCTIINSTVMENVVIGDDCTIEDSVVCPLAVLQDEVGIVECLVAANNTLEAGDYAKKKFTGPQFGEDEEDDE